MNSLTTRRAGLMALATWVSLAGSGAGAESAIFASANTVQGATLMSDAKCDRCHLDKSGLSTLKDFYKPDAKISSASSLRGMVENCNTQLGSGLFPDEVTDIAAYLNQRYYRFKD